MPQSKRPQTQNAGSDLERQAIRAAVVRLKHSANKANLFSEIAAFDKVLRYLSTRSKRTHAAPGGLR